MKKITLLLLIIAAAFALFACTGLTTEDPSSPERFNVMVTENEGINIKSQNPLSVERGGGASFEVEIEYGYLFKSVSAGRYDEKTGTLTLEDIPRATRIDFELEYVGYDVNEMLKYIFYPSSALDRTSTPSSVELRAGTEITVNADDFARRFVGWSVGMPYSDGGEIVSYDRSYTFRIRSDMLNSVGILKLYSNYTEANIYYYEPEGGILNLDSYNMRANDYYTAEVEGNRVKVTLLDKYYSYAECASTFFDDGTFTKDGSVLIEYNTRPDGSGTAYSLGSKFYSNGSEGSVLYCIWREAVSTDMLEYSSISIPRPESATYADFWNTDGVRIDKYLGDDGEVYLPEYINGKPVIAIAEVAFTDKNVEILSIPKTVHRVENGAFVRCRSLSTIYFPNSLYEMYDEALDTESYKSLKSLIVNGTMAPRNTKTTDGGFAVKLSRLLAAEDEKKIIIISGSSSYQGASSPYAEALFDNEYTFINFGTTRPRPGLFYLEALSHYTDSDDIFVYAPENSAFMMGESYLNWRFINDLEGMNNLFRYVDISKYYGYFSSFTELNQNTNYKKPPLRYEDIAINGSFKNGEWYYYTDKYGDYQHPNRNDYVGVAKYVDTYYITMNNRYKSINDGLWNLEDFQYEHRDYTDLTDETWTSIDRPELVSMMNTVIDIAKGSGAGVYFSFAPADANELVEEARNIDWLLSYDKLIEDLYSFDGLVGSCIDYIYATDYMYDCAFHLNNYGRAYRTYELYLGLCKILDIDAKSDYTECGTDFAGCLFEDGSYGEPLTRVDYLEENK